MLGTLQPLVDGVDQGPALQLGDGEAVWDPLQHSLRELGHEESRGAEGSKTLLRNTHADCESRTFVVSVKKGWRGAHVWRGEEVKPGRRFEEQEWADGEESAKQEVRGPLPPTSVSSQRIASWFCVRRRRKQARRGRRCLSGTHCPLCAPA
jgi:hypothetical protein